MYDRLLKLYKNKMVENVISFEPDKYYYFYNENNNVFGISKDITINEYELIKGMYIEKTFYYNSKMEEKIHSYLFDNQDYPFNKKNYQFFIYQTMSDHDQINGLLKDIFNNIEIIKYQEKEIVFFQNRDKISLEELFRTISFDFGKPIYVHQGFVLSGQKIKDGFSKYLKALENVKIIEQEEFSDSAMMLYKCLRVDFENVASFLKQEVIMPLLENEQNLDIINCFFKNELNVSKTANALYMHRNTLSAKIEAINAQTGFDISKFYHASCLLLLINYHN